MTSRLTAPGTSAPHVRERRRATTANVPATVTADGPATRNVRVAVVDKDGGFTSYRATCHRHQRRAQAPTLANSGPVNEGATGSRVTTPGRRGPAI